MLTRRTPMKRSAWTRKSAPHDSVNKESECVDDQAPVAIKKIASLRRGTYSGSTTAAAPKTVARRNPALLELARGRQCLLLVPGVCCFNPATTVACHSNLSQHGKAGARKADDCYSVWGCIACHTWLDQGLAPATEKSAAFMLALQRQASAWERIADAPDAKPRERRAALWALGQLLWDGALHADLRSAFPVSVHRCD